ncbi:protease inhibitor Inh/omp19 family protein [Dickeya oryzae]|uniref:Protease inhibitor Inh/omp19 family protein n=1 Tax=Dickeya oryzae TaxID=1240404 RepID=A0AB39IVG9_9GAMM|nr:protease inhibitor Inh/omp19 family protein [Dickeya oryzae]MBP2850105.1 protease inhibitor Inh/omp19 family protein [Dickeya oryzae]MBP2858056.1 protease inhibitor Inh/omp19 family protein [Dickeya oryzae]MCA6989355.1 protease inhibitor Inh/omp19 family protein [Dickeya oryzae]
MKKLIIATLLSALSGGCMASSLRLPSAAELSGEWVLSGTEQHCDIRLNTEVLDSTTWRLVGDTTCLQTLLPEAPVGWRPTPDGVTLTQSDGSAVAFFSRNRDQYEHTLANGSVRILKKKA